MQLSSLPLQRQFKGLLKQSGKTGRATRFFPEPPLSLFLLTFLLLFIRFFCSPSSLLFLLALRFSLLLLALPLSYCFAESAVICAFWVAAEKDMERQPGGILDTTFRLLLRRNSVYVAFVLTGALVGERVLDYGINKVWERNNMGKRFEDIPHLGSKVEES